MDIELKYTIWKVLNEIYVQIEYENVFEVYKLRNSSVCSIFGFQFGKVKWTECVHVWGGKESMLVVKSPINPPCN
jgi:hypothetical protein